MPIISCDEASDTRVLAARLAAHPKMLAKVLWRCWIGWKMLRETYGVPTKPSGA
ncbi:MAG: hypothetical protein V5B39_08830 [Accumulibacter sp.]|jgi:hypothetical protein|uniref:hypothetical protein n=1 Tax=Accumulibacter sp. TaxID=2053492 RepID=UPI002FC2A9FE